MKKYARTYHFCYLSVCIFIRGFKLKLTSTYKWSMIRDSTIKLLISKHFLFFFFFALFCPFEIILDVCWTRVIYFYFLWPALIGDNSSLDCMWRILWSLMLQDLLEAVEKINCRLRKKEKTKSGIYFHQDEIASLGLGMYKSILQLLLMGNFGNFKNSILPKRWLLLAMGNDMRLSLMIFCFSGPKARTYLLLLMRMNQLVVETIDGLISYKVLSTR